MDLDGVRVLDLYAGSGALGLEALSRGAAHLTAVERHRATAALVERNARDLGLADLVQVRTGAVERVLAARPEGEGPDRPGDGFDLVLLDPPYPLDEHDLADVLGLLVSGGWLAEDALVVVERSARSPRPAWPTGLVHLDTRTYGETALHLAEPVRGGPTSEDDARVPRSLA